MTIDEELAELTARSLFRTLRENESPAGPTIKINGRELINFGSNDYLGFANEPCLREAAKAAIDKWGVGSGASRLISGTMSPHVRLEERLADFKQTEAALTFSSGYAAAVGTLGSLLGKNDVVILDKLCHASLIDGARLSGATIRIFPHNSMDRLESHLRWARQQHPHGRVLVVTESVFSMDGDSPPLHDVVDLKARYGAMLLLDEAHAIGVIGPNGRGLAAHLQLTARIDLHMGTLSKALGASGGYICSTRRMIDLLINRARSFIYTTAPPPAIAAVACAALHCMTSEEGEQRRVVLHDNWVNLCKELSGRFRLPQYLTPIVPVACGSAGTALSGAERLRKDGFFVPAIRFPTVPSNEARLRVSLTAKHAVADILRLASHLTHRLTYVPTANGREHRKNAHGH